MNETDVTYKEFDAIEYFHKMARRNKLAHDNGFYACTCSGIGSLEDMLSQFRKQSSFICVEDTNDSATVCISGGWFTKRVITVFIMSRYRIDDMVDRQNKLELCRKIFHQFHSRMMVDREIMHDDLCYLNAESIASRELGQYFMSGLTGLYFMVDLIEPLNLCYNEAEWTE